MHNFSSLEFKDNFEAMKRKLLIQSPFNVGTWQSQKIEMPMLELLNVSTVYMMPETPDQAGVETGARLPWAEDHHLERVGGRPLNPAPSEAWWPFRKKSADGDTNKDHKSEGQAFSHTYPERMWPKRANMGMMDLAEHDPLRDVEMGYNEPPHFGIRFEYGDLGDVVTQLARDPYTRQAYLPLWFPEDTGAVHGKRVPCSLGWQFQIRHGIIHTTYFMRSTDLLRHYQDDIYLATRLTHWVRDRLTDATNEKLLMGTLTFHTGNMHIFEADRELIKYWDTQGKVWF